MSARDQVAKTGSIGVIFAIETAGHYWQNLAYFLDEQDSLMRRMLSLCTLIVAYCVVYFKGRDNSSEHYAGCPQLGPRDMHSSRSSTISL